MTPRIPCWRTRGDDVEDGTVAVTKTPEGYFRLVDPQNLDGEPMVFEKDDAFSWSMAGLVDADFA